MTRPHIRVRRELVFFALATMETCAIAPLVTALITLTTPFQPSALLVTELFLIALLTVHYITRASIEFSLHPALRASLLGLGMLTSGLWLVHQLRYAQTNLWNPAWLAAAFRDLQTGELLLSIDVLIFALSLFVWWRGIVLAQRRLVSGVAVNRFRSGLVMLAITTTVGGFLLPAPPYQFVFAFFFVSLVGIALARAEEVGQQYGGSQSPFGFGWLAMVVTASLGILLLAAGAATLLTGENLSRYLGPIWEVQRVVFALLTYAFLYILAWLGRGVIDFLKSLFGEVDLFRAFEGAFAPPNLEPVEQLGDAPFTPEQLAMTKAFGVIAVVLIVLLMVGLSVRKLRVRARRRDEDHESVWEEVNLRHSLRDLLNDGRRRLGEIADSLSRSRLGQIFAALTIRRIYAHLGALAAEMGHPRALHETPYEYRSTLEQIFPDNHADVGQITKAYVDVHYGEVPDQLADLEKIRAAWNNLREAAVKNSPEAPKTEQPG